MSVYSTRYLEDPDSFIEEEFNKFAEEICYQPTNYAYYGGLDPDVWGRLDFCGTHRDADVLTQSNFKVISEDLKEHYPDAIEVESSSHWAVGWVEVVRLDTRNRGALGRALSWKLKLDDYPIADEDTYSQMQLDEAYVSWQEWAREWVSDLILEHQDDRLAPALLNELDELNEDGEEVAYHAFESAYIDSGDDPRESEVQENLTYYYNQLLEDKRREFERYQPPMFPEHEA